MVYKYVATNQTGQTITNVADAPSIAALVLRLKNDGYLPLKITEARAFDQKKRFDLFKGRVNGKELAIFTRQLAATLSAGLLLTESLETIADDLENVYFRNVIRRVQEDIRAGADFSNALAKYPRIFPVTFISVVRSGEASGTLHKTMGNLAKYLESSERLKEKVKTAVRYPLFVFIFALIVVGVIVLFLIPKFTSMFLNAGAKLPLLTSIVVGVSQFCIKFFWAFALAGIAATIAYIYFMRKSVNFKRRVDSLVIRIPVLGKEIIHKALVSRFCRTSGYLFASGVGLAQALEIASQVVNHVPMSEAILYVKDRVVSGASIAPEMRKQKIFPRLTCKMVAVGEKTGNISDMFNKTADYYDEELDNSLSRLTSMIEPALIIFIGGIVLIVVLALYLPIFNMSAAIR